MRVLMINIDKKIFNPNSESLARIKLYSKFCEKLTVIVLTRKKHSPIIDGNLSIYPTNSISRVFYYRDALRLAKRMAKKDKSNLVATQDPFDTGIVGWKIKKAFNIPWHCQVHTDFLSKYFKQESFLNRIRVFFAKNIIFKTDHIRAVSLRIKKSLISIGIPDNRISVWPIFTDTNFRKSRALGKDYRKFKKDNKFIFLTVGRLALVKNIWMQIKAMKNVVKKYQKAELWIVGEGEERKNYESRIMNYGLQNNIKLLGWRDDLGKIYNQADAFLLTSNYEGWGMVVIEAAVAGLPIIMTDVGCGGEIIQDGESGIIIPVGSQEKLKNAMIKFIEDRELREKLGAGALRAVLSLPNKQETLKLYKESWEKTFLA